MCLICPTGLHIGTAQTRTLWTCLRRLLDMREAMKAGADVVRGPSAYRRRTLKAQLSGG